MFTFVNGALYPCLRIMYRNQSNHSTGTVFPAVALPRTVYSCGIFSYSGDDDALQPAVSTNWRLPPGGRFTGAPDE